MAPRLCAFLRRGAALHEFSLCFFTAHPRRKSWTRHVPRRRTDDHTFDVEGGVGTLSNADVYVAEVDFVDGSAWRIAPGGKSLALNKKG